MPEPQQQAQSRFQIIDVPWPKKGLDDSVAYGKQEPETTPDCLNVWNLDSRTNRLRGGSRHGLTRLVSALEGANPVQCLFQADASTLVVTTPPANITINTSTTASSVGTPTPSDQPANSLAIKTDYVATGNGAVVVPAEGTGYYMVVPNTENTSATKSSLLGGSNKYLGSCWRQNGHAVIISAVANSGGSSTLATALASSLSGSDTSISVANSDVFKTPAGTALTNFVVKIDEEYVRVSSITAATKTLNVASRGFNGSTAAAHGQGAAVTLVGVTPLTADCFSGITDSATAINVTNGAPFAAPTPFTIQVESELMRVTSKSVGGTQFGVTRGYGSTTNERHPANAKVRLFGESTLNTALLSGISNTDTTITVSSAAGFPTVAPFSVQIDDEVIKITGVSGTTWTTAAAPNGRGYAGTSAAAHATGSTISSAETTLAAEVNAGMTYGQTSMRVASVAPFTSFSSLGTYTLKVDDEKITVPTFASGHFGLQTDTKTFLQLTRGASLTSAARHDKGAVVRPYAQTTLTAQCYSGITAAATNLTLAATTTFFPNRGTYYIKIDSEVLKVTSTNTTTRVLSGITRGQDFTVAAAHQTGAMISLYGRSTISMTGGLSDTSTTTITLASGSLFPTVGTFLVLIDNEKILVARTSSTSNTLTIQANGRGYAATTRAAHANGATVTLVPMGTTTLASTGDTSLAVASTGEFPSSGSFQIRVENEEMLVTRNGSGAFTVSFRGYLGTTAADHASGTLVELSPVYGSTTVEDVGDTSISIATSSILPNFSSGSVTNRVLVVDGEEMTATSGGGTTISVTRTNPVYHASGGTVRLKTAPSTTLSSASISTSVIVDSATTFPGAAQFDIKIEQEQMRVTGVSGTTFTVLRGQGGTAIADHVAGLKVELVKPVGTSFLSDVGDASITVENAKMFPFAPNSGSQSGLSYPITVDSETMTVTAINSTTNVVTVTRTLANGATTHYAGAQGKLGFSAASTVTNAGGTTLTVASASSFPGSGVVPFVVQVDAEQMQVVAVSGSDFTVVRGFNGTAVGTHAANAVVTQLGAASVQQLQYEVRDQYGAAVKSLTNLMIVTHDSPLYGMSVQEQPGGSNNFLWVWVGSLKSLTDTFSGFDPTATANSGRECVLKYGIAANGTLSASTSIVSASTSGIIANKNSTHGTRLVNGMSSAAYAPRHGGMTIVPASGESQVVLTETGNYVTADSNFVATRLVAYGCNTGTKKSEQLIALPAYTYASGPVIGVPQQLVATGTRPSGAQFLLSQFVDGPGSTDSSKVVSVRASTFPTGVTAPAAVSTGVTGATATPQVHNFPEEVSLASSSPSASADVFTAVGYNPSTNRALVVRRRRAGGSGNTAEVFAMSYTGTAVGGGSILASAPMNGVSLEWCAGTPWGWLLAGLTSDGTGDLVALDHDLRPLNRDGTSMWSSSIGWTSRDSIKFPSANYVRLADHTAGTVPATPPKQVEYSDTAMTFSERTSGSFLVRLGAQPVGDVTISLTSSDVSVGTLSASTLTFTRQNWSSWQTVTVSGVAGSGTRTTNVTGTISSTADTDYNAIPTLPTVVCTVTDADAGVIYGEDRTSFTVKEGGTISLPVRLNGPPAANVVLTFTSPDTNQVTVSPTTLTFTSSNYATDQRVTITAVSDAVTEGNVTYTIAVTSASSDAAYNGPAFNPTDLSVTVEETRQPTSRVLVQLAVSAGRLYEVTRCTPSSTSAFSRIGTQAFSTSTVVRAANLGSRVFFADGQSALEYDAAAGVLRTFVPRAGLFPFIAGARPRGLVVWRERLFYFRVATDPQNWFCSRYQDPDDFNYRNTQDTVNTPQDVNAAQKGNFAAAGLFPGGVLNDIIPYNSDISIWGGDSGIFQMAGDPGAGAIFEEVVSGAGVGMAPDGAWCKDPLGQVYFWGRTGGLYRLRLNTPAQIMTDRVTSIGVERMVDVDLDDYVAVVKWDQYAQGVHVWLTPYAVGKTCYYSFFDAATESWWPMRYANSTTSLLHPLCAAVFDKDQANDRILVIGGRDGVTRKLDPDATTDDGTSFSSHVVIGPVTNPPGKVMLNRLQPDHSGASWSVLTGDTPSLALAASEIGLGSPENGGWSRRRVRGNVLYLKASKTSGVMSVDRVTAEIGSAAR